MWLKKGLVSKKECGKGKRVEHIKIATKANGKQETKKKQTKSVVRSNNHHNNIKKLLILAPPIDPVMEIT